MSERNVTLSAKELRLYRRLFLIAGFTYLIWWVAVRLLLPAAFNPLGIRLAISAVPLVIWVLSFYNARIRSLLNPLFLLCACLITAHYYYLFYVNGDDLNWIVGSYITVVAVSFCMLTGTSLMIYSLFVLLLSAVLVVWVPTLSYSVFLPGLLTMLVQANMGMRARLGLIKRAEADRLSAVTLKENVRVRDEFISLASHELKTPISVLKLQSQLIARDLSAPGNLEKEKAAKLIGVFDRQVGRLTELVETMLDVSMVSAGRLVLDPREIDLVALVKDSVALQTAPGRTSAEISIRAPERLQVKADASRLKQVIENLLSNAIKYGGGKPIEVEVRSQGADAVVQVRDHGIGIADDAKARIFDRFERAISNQNITGLGLGLYISKQIVEGHGGRISVASRIGEGSTFKIELPLRT